MNTTSIMDLCFLCTKDYNCVAVDNKIVSQVEYVLPEITIFKLGIPLRICSVCDGALCAFSTFKHSSLESSRRLETSIKGAQGPPLHTAGANVADNSEQLNNKPVKIEEIFITEEPMEQTSLDTRLHMEGPSANIQPHTHRALPNSTTQLQRVSAELLIQLHKHVLSQNIQLDTDTNSDNAENIFIKDEPLEETPQDREFYNNIIQDPLKEECNTKDKSATFNTSEEVWEESSVDSTEENVEETDTNCSKNLQNNKKREYRCNICSLSYVKKTYFTCHMKKNHWQIKDLSCSICKKIFAYHYDLNRHMKLHNGIKYFHCPVCKIRFSDKLNLKQHIKLHVDQKDFHCETCNRTFTLKTYLKNHITHKKHRVKETLRCSVCNKLCASERYLNRHMKIHSEVKDFYCHICNKSFDRKSNLIVHMKIHSGLKDFQCAICNKSFKQKCHLNVHMKTHSGVKDFQCNICNKSFGQKCHLVCHMKIHSGVKDFHCTICSRSFGRNSNLIAHMKIHSGVKKFRCDICSRWYTRQTNLNRHKKSHSGLKDL